MVHGWAGFPGYGELYGDIVLMEHIIIPLTMTTQKKAQFLATMDLGRSRPSDLPLSS